MVHHVSIPAKDPRHVAHVLAELRGSFRVIEFWVENRVMLEVLTPEMTGEYLDCVVKGK